MILQRTMLKILVIALRVETCVEAGGEAGDRRDVEEAAHGKRVKQVPPIRGVIVGGGRLVRSTGAELEELCPSPNLARMNNRTVETSEHLPKSPVPTESSHWKALAERSSAKAQSTARMTHRSQILGPQRKIDKESDEACPVVLERDGNVVPAQPPRSRGVVAVPDVGVEHGDRAGDEVRGEAEIERNERVDGEGVLPSCLQRV
jgi:hypothetical protein